MYVVNHIWRKGGEILPPPLIFFQHGEIVLGSRVISDKRDSSGLLRTRLANGEKSPDEYQGIKGVFSH